MKRQTTENKDFMKMTEQTIKWQVTFSVVKSQVMHIGETILASERKL